MNAVWKAIVGVLLAIAIICIVRVAMYGVESLPFMSAFSSGSNSGSPGTSGTSAPTNGTAAPAPAATTYSAPQRTAPAAPVGQPSGMPNPPTIYDRARRAGNRPSQGADE